MYNEPENNKVSLSLDKGKQQATPAAGGPEGPGGLRGPVGGVLRGFLPHFISYLNIVVVTKLFDNVNKLESAKDYVYW